MTKRAELAVPPAEAGLSARVIPTTATLPHSPIGHTVQKLRSVVILVAQLLIPVAIGQEGRLRPVVPLPVGIGANKQQLAVPRRDQAALAPPPLRPVAPTTVALIKGTTIKVRALVGEVL